PPLSVDRIAGIGVYLAQARIEAVVNLVAQGTRLDLHWLLDPGHAIDQERVRPRHVDDNRGGDLSAVGKRDTGYAAVRAPILTTSARNRNRAPCASAARCRLWVASWGSLTYPEPGVVDSTLQLPRRLIPDVIAPLLELHPKGRGSGSARSHGARWRS